VPTLDKQRLLHGPYKPPALRAGDRTDCLMRGTVVITGWAAAPINTLAKAPMLPTISLDPG
jgi:hypothetical protein